MSGASAQSPRGTSAALVREARQRRGMSQRDLARAAGVPQSTVANIEAGRQQPSVAMLERLLTAAGFRLEPRLVNTVRPGELLERHRDRIAELLARYPINRAWVFGSVARGDDRPGSDLDVLIEPAPTASFTDYVGLEDALAELLACPVDIITTNELKSNELLQHRVNRDRRQLEIAS
ncbi:helix-turn-helix domain-containing protein [Mycolicibacter heraklionensis]|uniref:Helix-turn-helix domain-containing protein n=2 Tax=Mycolicibacter heraklionensis TaxID=512402 RepID=A0A9X7ZFM1_9MYCO|nr:helix-turn-helix domain-containing protein [Mycolicibacter heraklionensis]QZA06935.1 helix-turn-helix domain-containing protein [Mycolicibacter heraklionensis]